MLEAYIMAWFNARYQSSPLSASVVIYQVSNVTVMVSDALGKQYLAALFWIKDNDPDMENN